MRNDPGHHSMGGVTMDARELTKIVVQLEARLIKAEKEIQFLENENEKLSLRLKDLEIDVRQK